jgi:hypothetical protein
MGVLGQAVRIFATGFVVLVLAFSAYQTWQWLDRSLLHWGIEDDKVTVVDEAELVERLRAFEVVTVKHVYDSSTAIDAGKRFAAGPARVSLPGWVAGQDLEAKGRVEVAAGVDLGRLSAADIEVFRDGAHTRVVVRVPAPELLSRELLLGTLDMDTSQGVLTRLKTRIGLSEKDLRDQAADRLALAAEARALEEGILSEAGLEAKLRLERFLNDIGAAAGQDAVYTVEVAEPPAS